MRTLNVGLTAEQKAARQGCLGGSDANLLMNGDADAILTLWEEKTGAREPVDLSGVLPVMLGSWTEEFNRYWFEKMTGRIITHEGESRKHPEHSFMACTLDGLVEAENGDPAVFEAKHVNGFSKIDEVEQRSQPQLHHNMAVCGMGRAVLSVFVGTQVWEHTEVSLDDWYLAELIDRERAFWAAVVAKEPPPGMKPIAAPVKPEKFRTVDMAGSNSWAEHAGIWIKTKDAAKQFSTAEKEIKALIEPDVGTAFGRGIVCKRSKNGALRISTEK